MYFSTLGLSLTLNSRLKDEKFKLCYEWLKNLLRIQINDSRKESDFSRNRAFRLQYLARNISQKIYIFFLFDTLNSFIFIILAILRFPFSRDTKFMCL